VPDPFPTPDDVNAIRGLILAQFAAFADDDAGRAFSFASAAIRRLFGTAEAFLEMVRRSYADVHGARAAAVFGVLRGGGSQAMQLVQLAGPDGRRTAAACYELVHELRRGWLWTSD
jgi:hypothetical protein